MSVEDQRCFLPADPDLLLSLLFLPHLLLLLNSESCSVVSDTLRLHRLCSSWNSPGQNIGVGSRSLLQGIFPTQGLNPGLPHYRLVLYQLSHKGSPRILECVAVPFSSGSSQPKNQTKVSCIAGGFLTNWAIREVPPLNKGSELSIYGLQRFFKKL